MAGKGAGGFGSIHPFVLDGVLGYPRGDISEWADFPEHLAEELGVGIPQQFLDEGVCVGDPSRVRIQGTSRGSAPSSDSIGEDRTFVML